MQQDGPLVHILYDELCTLIKSLLRRFMLDDVPASLNGYKLKYIDMKDTTKLTRLQDVDIGIVTGNEIRNYQEKTRFQFRKECRDFLITVVSFLLSRVSLDCKLLRNLQCLHPVIRVEEKSLTNIINVAKSMPAVFKLEELDAIKREWLIYMAEDIEEKGEERVDYYWARFLEKKHVTERLKYPTLGRLVKSCLTLTHGQAHIERGFSLNKTNVTAERSRLKIESVNGLRNIQDTVHKYGSATQVPITPKFLSNFREAHKKLVAAKEKKKNLEAEEKQEDMEQHKRKLEEDRLCNEKKIEEKMKRGKLLIAEANNRLTDFVEIAAAQSLLSTCNKYLEEATADEKKFKAESCKKRKTK